MLMLLFFFYVYFLSRSAKMFIWLYSNNEKNISFTEKCFVICRLIVLKSYHFFSGSYTIKLLPSYEVNIESCLPENIFDVLVTGETNSLSATSG